MQRPPKPKATPCSLSPSFDAAHLNHLSAPPTAGTGAWDTLTPDDFARAITEISGWHGYAPTPLHPLQGLAQALSLGEVLYKHEGPRFGIGSFKALGAAYVGLCVLQTNSQIPLAAWSGWMK